MSSRGFNLSTCLRGILWCGICAGAGRAEGRYRRWCEERWMLKGRTLWVVRRKDPNDHKLDLLADPGQAQVRAWKLADQGIETFPPYAAVVGTEEPECQ